jgi:hypothetical protein
MLSPGLYALQTYERRGRQRISADCQRPLCSFVSFVAKGFAFPITDFLTRVIQRSSVASFWFSDHAR